MLTFDRVAGIKATPVDPPEPLPAARKLFVKLDKLV
jgi:hypothetical protein